MTSGSVGYVGGDRSDKLFSHNISLGFIGASEDSESVACRTFWGTGETSNRSLMTSELIGEENFMYSVFGDGCGGDVVACFFLLHFLRVFLLSSGVLFGEQGMREKSLQWEDAKED